MILPDSPANITIDAKKGIGHLMPNLIAESNITITSGYHSKNRIAVDDGREADNQPITDYPTH
jgi:hypothetical protein